MMMSTKKNTVMNDYSKKSVKNLGILILLGIVIVSYVIVCASLSSGETINFIWTIAPTVSMVYGVVSFLKRYFILK